MQNDQSVTPPGRPAAPRRPVSPNRPAPPHDGALPPGDDIEIVPDVPQVAAQPAVAGPPAVPAASPPTAPAGFGPHGPNPLPSAPPPIPKKPMSKRNKVLAIGGVVVLGAVGLGALFFVGELTNRELRAASNDFFAAYNNEANIAPLLDGTQDCMTTADFPTVSEAGPVTWRSGDVKYALTSGDDDDATRTSSSTMADELAGEFRRGRPGGTDVGSVDGVLEERTGATDVEIFFVREPGEEWLLCRIFAAS